MRVAEPAGAGGRVIHGDQHYVTTISGRRFWILDPRADDIDIHDIAHALAHICRFNGHVKTFYSVAQHSLLVAAHVPPAFALHALLHDAAEAYIGDLSSPLKHDDDMWMYREADRRLTRLIYQKVGLSVPTGVRAQLIDDVVPDAVKAIDRAIMCDEIRDIALHVNVRQPHLQGPGLGIRISAMEPDTARRAFLFRFSELTQRQEAA